MNDVGRKEVSKKFHAKTRQNGRKKDHTGALQVCQYEIPLNVKNVSLTHNLNKLTNPLYSRLKGNTTSSVLYFKKSKTLFKGTLVNHDTSKL